jgi:hypothetical protein
VIDTRVRSRTFFRQVAGVTRAEVLALIPRLSSNPSPKEENAARGDSAVRLLADCVC